MFYFCPNPEDTHRAVGTVQGRVWGRLLEVSTNYHRQFPQERISVKTSSSLMRAQPHWHSWKFPSIFTKSGPVQGRGWNLLPKKKLKVTAGVKIPKNSWETTSQLSAGVRWTEIKPQKDEVSVGSARQCWQGAELPPQAFTRPFTGDSGLRACFVAQAWNIRATAFP